MIAFATLLLGLIVGPQPIELLVGDAVVTVEILLDGERMGTLREGDWKMVCDFGSTLEPHRLVAVAFDDAGAELGRVRQWINLPRGPAEAAVALEGGNDGQGVVAALSWESVVGEEPTAVRASLDGRPLPVVTPNRIELPPFDPDRLHFFRAEIDFPNSVTSSVELTFAGSYTDRVSTDLTAISVALGRKARLPGLGALAGRFRIGLEPLEVVAAEEGPAELIVVRDQSARRDLAGLLQQDKIRLWRRAGGRRLAREGSLPSQLSLPSDVTLRFLWPVSHREARSEYALEIFPPSPAYTALDGDLSWLLTSVRQPAGAPHVNRFADAVAAAALLATERHRRRAVLLVIGSDPALNDPSQFSVPSVRRFLRDLGVPLVVWSTSRQPRIPPTWGRPIEVSSFPKLDRAVVALFSDLERQRIIWLRGSHLPQEVRIDASGLDLQLIR